MSSDGLSPFGIIVIIALQKVREEKELENDEEDKELKQNQHPQLTPQRRHIAEAVVIKTPHPYGP